MTRRETENSSEYQSFDECVAYHARVTIMSTAVEICSLEFEGTGDVQEVDVTLQAGDTASE